MQRFSWRGITNTLQANFLNTELDWIQLRKGSWLGIFECQYPVLKMVLSDRWWLFDKDCIVSQGLVAAVTVKRSIGDRKVVQRVSPAPQKHSSLGFASSHEEYILEIGLCIHTLPPRKPPSLAILSRWGWESRITNCIQQGERFLRCSQTMISLYTSQKSSVPFNKEGNFSVSWHGVNYKSRAYSNHQYTESEQLEYGNSKQQDFKTQNMTHLSNCNCALKVEFL